MRRRSREGGEPTIAQRRKTGTRKSRVTPKAARGRSSSIASLEAKVARLTHERDESLESRASASPSTSVLRPSASSLEAIRSSSARRLLSASSAAAVALGASLGSSSSLSSRQSQIISYPAV
jgi:hypothetical protein